MKDFFTRFNLFYIVGIFLVLLSPILGSWLYIAYTSSIGFMIYSDTLVLAYILCCIFAIAVSGLIIVFIGSKK